MEYYNLTDVEDEYPNDIEENDLEDPKNEFMDYCNLTDIKDEYIYDVKDTKEYKRLRVEENENLKRTAQILELCNMKKISKPVKFIKNPLDYVNQPVFLQKSEIKFSESSLFTLVDDLCTIVKEDREEEQTPISPSKDPLSDLHITQAEHHFKCSTCQKSFSNRRAFTRHTKIHINERNFVCLECNKTFQRPSHLKEHARIHNNIKKVQM